MAWRVLCGAGNGCFLETEVNMLYGIVFYFAGSRIASSDGVDLGAWSLGGMGGKILG